MHNPILNMLLHIICIFITQPKILIFKIFGVTHLTPLSLHTATGRIISEQYSIQYFISCQISMKSKLNQFLDGKKKIFVPSNITFQSEICHNIEVKWVAGCVSCRLVASIQFSSFLSFVVFLKMCKYNTVNSQSSLVNVYLYQLSISSQQYSLDSY